jgi:hypothetical protein
MASEIKVDTISEKTSANGVTIDGLTIKDGGLGGHDITFADGAYDFDVASHDTSNGLKLGGTLVTATAAELNIMDGVTATAAEINLIDGGTARGTTAIADGDGVLINDAGTMRMTTVQTLKTYIGGSDPSSADGDSLGTASLEWSDLYLADGSIIYMGADQDVTIQHNHNGGVTMKNDYGSTEGMGLHLHTGETTVVANDPIGFIKFRAPDEASGTDAVLSCAEIQAIAEGTFAADNNATKLSFYTGASEAATEKMSISSAGNVSIASGNIVMSTSGKGIDFSATGDGSGTDTSELFDDYEEGTWSPSFGNYGGTETVSQARYVKIGRMVYAGFKIETDGASDTSNAQVNGLPYTVVNTTNGASGAGIVAYTTGNAAQRWRAGANESTFYVYDNTGTNLTYNDLGANKIFELNFIYEAA